MSRRGMRGHPVATIAYYGPNDRYASKAVVSILASEDADPDPLKKWFERDLDVRRDATIEAEILAFLKEHGAISVVMADRIIGCPHEEGIDYPEGAPCPQCPYWAYRNRWTGEIEG